MTKVPLFYHSDTLVTGVTMAKRLTFELVESGALLWKGVRRGVNIERVANIFVESSRIACSSPDSESSRGGRRLGGPLFLIKKLNNNS